MQFNGVQIENTPNVIVITDSDQNQVIVTQPLTSVVEVSSPGPQGPKGESAPFVRIGTSNTWYTTSDIEITGSLIVSSSNTFKNIGTGIFSGSLLISGSALYNGFDILTTAISGGFVNTSSFNVFSSSYVADSASFNTRILINSSSITILSGSFLSLSSSYLIASASFDSRINLLSASFQNLSSSYVINSGSVSTRLSSLEQFSSSLDATFATDAQLNAATASLSSSIAVLSSSFLTTSASFNTRINDLSVSSSGISASLAGYVTTSSFNSFSSSYNTGSFTGSFTGTGTFSSLNTTTATITGNVTVLGTASINTLVVNQTQYTSGSNQLGDGPEDVQTLFGTVRIPTGSLTVTGSTIISSSASTQLQVGSNLLFVSSSGRVGIGTTTPTTTLNINGTTLLQGGQTTVRGSGTTSATTTLLVQNANTSASLTIRDDGFVSSNGIGFISTNTGFGNAFGTNIQSTAIENTAFGQFTLTNLTTGIRNTAIGYNVLSANTFGLRNTVIGAYAGTSNISGSDNTAIGMQAMYLNTQGSTNTAVGEYALYGNSVGSSNIGIGVSTLFNNQSGSSNIAIGHLALNNYTGSENVAIGREALFTNISGIQQTAVGHNALRLATGNSNTAVGFQAGDAVSTGTSNTLVGVNAGGAITIASFNVAVGFNTLAANSVGSTNVAIGGGALEANTASNNVAVGHQALNANTSGVQQTALGYRALALATGDTNTAIGFQAGDAVSTGINNVFVGADSGGSTTTGQNNVAIGTNALLSNTITNDNVAIGRSALQNNTVSNNVAIGRDALLTNTSGINQTAVGHQALRLATGGSNTALGYRAGLNISTATNNVIIGDSAGTVLTSGGNNTLIGKNAQTSASNDEFSVGIGIDSITRDRSITIGHGALSTAASQIVIGSGSIGISGVTNTTVIGTVNTVRTSLPGGDLVLGTTSSLNAKLGVRGTGTTSATTALRVENANASASLVVLDDNTSIFNTNTLYVSGSGNVGIGTSTPITSLDVNGRTRIAANSGPVGAIGGITYALSLQNNATNTWLEILNNRGAGRGAFFGLDRDNFEIWNYQSGSIDFYTSTTVSDGTRRLTITNNGNVGIGTSTPSASLHISASSGNDFFRITSGSQNILTVRSGSAVMFSGTGVTPTTGFDLDVQGTGTANGGSVRFAGNGSEWRFGSVSSVNRPNTGNQDMFNVTMTGTSPTFIQNPMSITFNANQNPTSGSGYTVLRLNATHATTAGTGSKLLQTWEFGGVAQSVMNTSGSLGLRTTSPSATLDVSGSGRFTNGLIVSSSITSSGPIVGLSSFTLSSNAAINGTVNIGSFSIATEKLKVRGIGTTSATTTLRIENANSSASLIITDDGSVNISGSLNVSGSITLNNTNIQTLSIAYAIALG